MDATDRSLLGIYLNDHLAGSTGGANLAERLAANHRGTDAGPVLEEVSAEIAEDRETLLELMAELGVPVSRPKLALAWVGERAARLKLNGRLMRRSPLSSVVELEAMALGVQGKAAGWRALRAAGVGDPSHLDELLTRAERQFTILEKLRVQAAGEVFSGAVSGGVTGGVAGPVTGAVTGAVTAGTPRRPA